MYCVLYFVMYCVPYFVMYCIPCFVMYCVGVLLCTVQVMDVILYLRRPHISLIDAIALDTG